MSRSVWRALPIVVATVGAGFHTGQWILIGPILVAALLPIGVERRFVADRLAQLAMWLAAVAFAGIAVTRLYPKDVVIDPLLTSPGWTFLALAGLLVATPRLWLAAPIGGRRFTAAFTLLAVMSCGDVARGGSATYLAFVTVYLLVQLFALMKDDPAWSRSWPLRPMAPVIMAVVAAMITGGLAIGVPLLHERVLKLFGSWRPGGSQSGFSDFSELDDLRGFLQSDEVVMRVFGPAPEHLRGVVYQSYHGGRWASIPSPLRPQQLTCEPGPDAVEVHHVGGSDSRYFMPLRAGDVGVEGCLAGVTTEGLVRPLGPIAARSWFRPASDEVLPVSPAAAADRVVPRALEEDLRRLADEWTAELVEAPPRQRLEAIANRLRTQYTYSLDFARTTERDPLLEFLEDRRTGHCEYFASAMTLLARASGVHARMVGGYRVTEYNPVGGYHIVRERNAHAWAEVWLGGAWQTIDATAAGDLAMPTEPGKLDAVLDAISAWLTIARIRILAFDPLASGGVVAVLFVAWFWLRRRRALGGPRGGTPGGYADPLPGLVALLDGLAAAGFVRHESEPIETLARRVAPTDETSSALLGRYAAWRYGRTGDEADLLDALRTRAAALSRTGRRTR